MKPTITDSTVIHRLCDFVVYRFHGTHIDDKMLSNAIQDFLAQELGSPVTAAKLCNLVEAAAKDMKSRRWDEGRLR